MSDYKQTLNLPQTDFPMKANLALREPIDLEKWRAMDLYHLIREKTKGRPKLIMHDGPPYANGHIHVGHALNKIPKDMIAKSKTLSGFDAPYVPGWDCHGLPIEHQVEKKYGKPGQKIDAKAFREACRAYANSQIDIQRTEFMRLGIIGDWMHPYVTMDYTYEANIIRGLAKIIGGGHLKRGYNPVHWCLDCASALAEAEVEYAEKTSSALDVAFDVINPADFLKRMGCPSLSFSRIIVPIWTTTPWTLPANQAVTVHPELMYVLVQHGADAFIIAEELLPSVFMRYGFLETPRILATIRGSELEGVQLKHPFYERHVPIILGHHVTVDAGTGAVHTAPAHGVDDFFLCKQYHLPLDNPVGDDGCFTANTPLVAGLHVNKADKVIIRLLEERSMLLHNETIKHSYPHCWRHKTPLIFRATPQWFISMDQAHLREKTSLAIKQTKWVPDWGQARILGMVQTRPDWCISRQRAWGIPLALFIHKETGELHPNTLPLMEAVAQYVEKEGVEAWFQLDPKTLLGEEEANLYQKTKDVLDVWFDSGMTHECVLKKRPELGFPADVVFEGSDQHRGWFQSLLLTSVAINHVPPYRTVLTHGFTVDGQGRKMSKSLGNVIAPDEVIASKGADILRLWVASVDFRGEIAISQEILMRNVETYRRIRNTARFLLANLHGFDPALHLLPPEKMLLLDRYIVRAAILLQVEVMAAFDAYQFHVIVQKIHHFCVNELGGFYLDIIKDRQYTMPENSIGRRSAQTALFHLTQALVRWLAPILSFTAEEIWSFIPGSKEASVFLTLWYTEWQTFETLTDKVDWTFIRNVRDAVNKEIENKRQEGVLGSALEAEVMIYADKASRTQLRHFQNELRFLLITSSAKVSQLEPPPNAIKTDIPRVAISIEVIKDAKCERCWHRCADVNANLQYPGLCGRCITNITTPEGEVRFYA